MSNNANQATNTMGGRRIDTRQMATMAMLSAIGIVLAILFRFPLIPAAAFLKYDPADIPILIGTMIYGPGAGFIMTLVVSAIHCFMVGSSGIPGFVMRVAATGAMALAVGFLFHKTGRPKTMPRAAGSLLVGCVVMVAVMCVMNLIITPLFLGRSLEDVVKMLVPAIIPFNALRSGINSLATFLLYRVVEKLAVR